MGFEVKCKRCQSTDCVIESLIDYDWDETPIEDGIVIRCQNCDYEERY